MAFKMKGFPTHLTKKAKKEKTTKKVAEQKQPTWAGTDEYRDPKDIPAKEYKERGLKKKETPNKKRWIDKPILEAFGLRKKSTDPVPGGQIDRQNKQDAENIKKNTSQTTDRETNKSVRRQNKQRVDKLSRKQVQKELKEQKKQGKNPSSKMDTSWFKRNFGTTKSLKRDLRVQQYRSDQNPVGHDLTGKNMKKVKELKDKRQSRRRHDYGGGQRGMLRR